MSDKTPNTLNSIPEPLPFTDNYLKAVCSEVIKQPISVEWFEGVKEYIFLHGRGTENLDDPNIPQMIYPADSTEGLLEREGYLLKLVIQDKHEKLKGLKSKLQDDYDETYYDAVDHLDDCDETYYDAVDHLDDCDETYYDAVDHFLESPLDPFSIHPILDLHMGNYYFSFTNPSLSMAVVFFILRVLVLFLYIWVRAAFPRYRYDQLMGLGRKVFLPLSLARVVPVSGVSVTFRWRSLNVCARKFLQKGATPRKCPAPCSFVGGFIARSGLGLSVFDMCAHSELNLCVFDTFPPPG